MTAPMVDYKIHWLKMMPVPESRAVVGRHDGINGRDRLSVGFTTATALVHELMEARDEKRLLRFQKQLAKYSLLVRGWVQRAGETVHLVAARLEDLSRWLDLLTPDCGSVRTSPDRARHGGRRLAAPHPRHPRDQRMVPRSRDFR